MPGSIPGSPTTSSENQMLSTSGGSHPRDATACQSIRHDTGGPQFCGLTFAQKKTDGEADHSSAVALGIRACLARRSACDMSILSGTPIKDMHLPGLRNARLAACAEVHHRHSPTGAASLQCCACDRDAADLGLSGRYRSLWVRPSGAWGRCSHVKNMAGFLSAFQHEPDSLVLLDLEIRQVLSWRRLWFSGCDHSFRSWWR